MTANPDLMVEKQFVRRASDRAVGTYDDHAALERLVVDNLLENLALIRIKPNTILDIGAGTGYCARGLVRRYPRAHTLLVDLSPLMLAYARGQRPHWRSRQRYVCADAEALPVRDSSIDFVFSSLTFQWCNDLDRVFTECHRVLKPNGLLLFSSLGPDTLYELRESWAAIDESPRINQFIDMHDVGDALIRSGFSSPVLECDPITVNYDDVNAVMRDLRGIGAVNSLRGRRRGLSTRRKLDRMAQHYEKFRCDDKLPATYEVVYAHAWRPAANSRPQDGSTVATFPLIELRRRS